MGYQHMGLSKAILIVFLVILGTTFTTQQEDSCFLPDGKRMSTCMRLHYCNQFQQVLRQYYGRPPMAIIQDINAHICGDGGYVCCPDNAVLATTTTTTTTARPMFIPSVNTADLPQRSILQSIRNHQNFNLINERSCGTSNTNRIVGGVDADLYEIPWAVLLGYQLLDGLKWQCGGSLISKKFVLSAAHCVTRELSVVRLGEYKISTEEDCDEYNSCADPVQDIKIERIIKHPAYKSSTRKNDIALLRLASSADTTKNNVKTVCLPIDADSDLENIRTLKRPMTIFGWGRIGDGDRTADILQKAFLPLVDNQDCLNKYAPYNVPIYPSYLCAGGHNKTDSCKGDSGSGITALASLDRKPKVVLYGVTSFGTNCDNPNVVFPGIYTNVHYYLDWILNNMSQ